MAGGWQYSAGDLSEVTGPALFVLAALASAWVFRDARRRADFGARSVWAWALLTLLFPPSALPLYLAARLFTRRAGVPEPSPTEAAEKPEAEEAEADDPSPDEGETAVRDGGGPAGEKPARTGLAPTLLYAAAVVLAGGLYFYADYRSFDAHLARAEREKLRQRPERTVAAYRAALRVREDGHTRKLLGLELLQAGRHEEALAELHAAARGGEPADAVAPHLAATLDALGRPDEAAEAYRQFLQTPRCARPAADPHCEAAGARLRALDALAR